MPVAPSSHVHRARPRAGFALALVLLASFSGAQAASTITFQGRTYDVNIIPLAATYQGFDLIFFSDPQFGKALVIPGDAVTRGCYASGSKLFYKVDAANKALRAFSSIKCTYLNLDGSFNNSVAADTSVPSKDISLPILFAVNFNSDLAVLSSDSLTGDTLLYRDGVSKLSDIYLDSISGSAVTTTPLSLNLVTSKPVAVDLDTSSLSARVLMLSTQATDSSLNAAAGSVDRLSSYDRSGLFVSEVLLSSIQGYKGFASGLAVDTNGDIYILDKDQLIVIGSQVPKLTGITPKTGNNDGSTTVTITGNRFPTDAKVYFGGTLATNVTSLTTTQIICNAPTHANGIVDVTMTGTGITNTLTLSQSFTYVTPKPVISIVSLTPKAGSFAGGTTVQIVGANFPSDSAVYFDDIAATNVKVVSSGLLTCVTPAHPTLAKVDVKLTGTDIPADSPVIAASAYTYLNLAPVAALAVNPNAGDPPLDVTFDITGTSDPEGQLATLSLDYGDNSTLFSFPSDLSQKTVTHTYANDGTFLATLTVTDSNGGTSKSTARVIVGSGGGTYNGTLLLTKLSLTISNQPTQDNTDSLTISGSVVLPAGVDLGELKYGSVLVTLNGIKPAQQGVDQADVEAGPLNAHGQRKYPEESFSITTAQGPGILPNTFSFVYTRTKVFMKSAKPAQITGTRAQLPVELTLTTRRNRQLIFSKTGNNQAVVNITGNPASAQTITLVRN